MADPLTPTTCPSFSWYFFSADLLPFFHFPLLVLCRLPLNQIYNAAVLLMPTDAPADAVFVPVPLPLVFADTCATSVCALAGAVCSNA